MDIVPILADHTPIAQHSSLVDVLVWMLVLYWALTGLKQRILGAISIVVAIP
jgi:hypothetical protein